ncbi:unnamed protein product, partial [Prorocentrum cordatum]
DARTKFVELRAKHLEPTRQATVPPQGNARESTMAPLAARGLDATNFGDVLRTLGAGEQAMVAAGKIALALAAIFQNASVQVVGSTRPAVADADAEELRAPLREAGVPVQEEDLAMLGNLSLAVDA